jgi:hypothetical protein
MFHVEHVPRETLLPTAPANRKEPEKKDQWMKKKDLYGHNS